MPSRSTWKLNLLAAGQGVSSAGDAMTPISLMLAFQSAGADPLLVSLVLVLGLLPSVLLGPVLAPLVDRMESSRLLQILLPLRFGVGLALAFTDHVPLILLFLFTGSAVSALVGPTMSLLTPRTVPEVKDPGFAFARVESFRSFGTIFGPMLAGALIDAFGARTVLTLDACSFLVVAAVVTLLRVRRYPPEHARSAGLSWLAQIKAGPVSLGQDLVIAAASLSLAGAIVFTALLTVGQVYFLRTDLALSPALYGLVVSMHAVGRFLAATFLAPRIHATRQARALFLGGMAMGAALIIIGLGHNLFIAGAGFLVTGAANTIQGLALRTIVTTRAAPETLGRSFASLGALNNGATLLGSLAAAPLVSLAGGALTLIIAGAGTLASTLAATRRLWQLNLAPSTEPAPAPASGQTAAAPAGTKEP